jgi:RHS repeat-associated protein
MEMTRMNIGTRNEVKKLPGQYYDEETRLHHNGFRTYDPSIGRYIQSDPIGIRDGTNTYSYVSNNPLVFTDVFGLAKFMDFNGQREIEMRMAIEEAKRKLVSSKECNDKEPCVDPKLALKIINRLENTTYNYRGSLSSCARATNVLFNIAAFEFITVGDSAFDGAACCDLSSTLAHEAGHLVGLDQTEAFRLEKDCFNCPR